MPMRQAAVSRSKRKERRIVPMGKRNIKLKEEEDL